MRIHTQTKNRGEICSIFFSFFSCRVCHFFFGDKKKSKKAFLFCHSEREREREREETHYRRRRRRRRWSLGHWSTAHLILLVSFSCFVFFEHTTLCKRFRYERSRRRRFRPLFSTANLKRTQGVRNDGSSSSSSPDDEAPSAR